MQAPVAFRDIDIGNRQVVSRVRVAERLAAHRIASGPGDRLAGTQSGLLQLRSCTLLRQTKPVKRRFSGQSPSRPDIRQVVRPLRPQALPSPRSNSGTPGRRITTTSSAPAIRPPICAHQATGPTWGISTAKT